MNQKKKTVSWAAIVVVLIIFWPVGLIMLFTKLSNDRTAIFGGGAAIIKFIGFTLMFFGAIMLLTIFSGDIEIAGTGIVLAAIFAVPGLYLVKKSSEMKKSGSKNRKYIDFIINNQIHDVHELARRLNVSQDEVIKHVNEMIHRGMLGGARLNLNSGVIEFPRPKPKPRPQQYQQPTQSRNPEPKKPAEHVYESFEPKTIRCSACSANNFIESLPAQCEYCGNSLH